MTNYITQMMQTAGISEADMTNNVDDYEYNHWTTMGYPPFTAEKQLELIKLISTNTIDTPYRNLSFDKDGIDGNWYFGFNVGEKVNAYRAINKDFTYALAQLTTELMNTGELDKEKVKEILKNG